MKPDQEKSMRDQLGDYGRVELIDLAISLQDVIDEHIQEKRGLTTSNNAMASQMTAMRDELDKLDGKHSADPAEIEAMSHEIAQLKIRCDDLQKLNEGLQRKLLG